MSEFPAYESHLREHVKELYELYDTNIRAVDQWKQILSEHNAEYFVQEILRIALREAKVLLNADKAPTVEQVLALPEIGDDYSPGVYHGVLTMPGNANQTWAYVGSDNIPAEHLTKTPGKHVERLYSSKLSVQRGR